MEKPAMVASEGLAILTHDELLAKVSAVVEAPIVPVVSVGRRGTSSVEERHIGDLGFNRRTNFFVGAIVLAVLGTVALLTLRLVFWIP